ncbi:MAG: type II toxin-antitoxin system VapC family toxin [Actinobacteria bacterium]|nr:type II toxin-antitoxin system VapC family toxin [Actinomycetota bacterium]
MSEQGGAVLDASAAIRWVLRDGHPEAEAKIDSLLTDGFVLVPELWQAEMANAFGTAMRAGRVDAAFMVDVCERLDQLDIRTDVVGSQVQRLALEAQKHGLTSHDACYLLLARDRGLPLATLDRELAKAAAANVALLLPT